MKPTIAQCRAELGLNYQSYRALRVRFAEIFKEAGFTHKQPIPRELWQEAKNKLISENSTLQLVLSTASTTDLQRSNDEEGHKLDAHEAFDQICINVVDRPTDRSQWTAVQFVETIGISPKQGRQLRDELYGILNRMANGSPDFVGTKTALGPERWETLVKEWTDSSAVLETSSTYNHDELHHRELLSALDGFATCTSRQWQARQRERVLAKRARSGLAAVGSPSPVCTESGRSYDDKDRVHDAIGVNRAESKTNMPVIETQGLSYPGQLPTPGSLPTKSLDDANQNIDTTTTFSLPIVAQKSFTMQLQVHEASTVKVENPAKEFDARVPPANVKVLLGHVFKQWPDFKGPVSSIDGIVGGNFLKIFSVSSNQRTRHLNKIEDSRLAEYLQSVRRRGMLPVFAVTLERPTIMI